ncbi:hypothetical protein FA95DRAFT_1561148 [Auriscalpium vulgare]|uniref:Uncharacterized protein n=1 Tax=Auriscalpium vulgare TaxID=40419 RepID=A0ACB8RMF7_9AGAM|nr:hypothetical protein FA95DRAFT_1561148 [Auriscalpium vulgare]
MDGQKEGPGKRFSDISTNPAAFWSTTLDSRVCHVDSSSLSTVDSRINASAPISRLPPELLLSIFSYFLDQEHWERCPVEHAPRTAPWVRFAHVCRRWRHVMLTSPSLWRSLVFPLPHKWARTMLTRSQSLPLLISCHADLTAHSSDWRMPFDTLAQVKIFDLSGFKGRHPDLTSLLSTPAPLLEMADVIMPPDLPPAQLFADDAPRLRKLTVRQALSLPWTSSFLRHLVSLEIVSSEIDTLRDSLPSLPDYLAALRQLSQIETLLLNGCLHPFSSVLPSQVSDSEVVQLPLLHRLDISGSVSECVGFLHHIKTPNTVALGVTSITEEGIWDFDEIYPFLAPTREPYRDAVFESTGANQLTLFARHARYGPTDRLFRFQWDDPEDTAIDLMCTLCAMIGVRHLSSLSINLDCEKSARNHGPWIDPAVWLDTFGGATELESLGVSGMAGVALCKILAASMEDETWRRSGVAGGTIVWPRLRDLLLYQVNFARSFKRVDGEEGSDIAAGMRVDEVLLRELERRHRRGAPLDKLDLLSCSLASSWLRKVGGIVASLDADSRVNAVRSDA